MKDGSPCQTSRCGGKDVGAGQLMLKQANYEASPCASLRRRAAFSSPRRMLIYLTIVYGYQFMNIP